MDVRPSHLRVVRSHHVEYAHHVSSVCTPYASNVGDVPEYVYPFHICEATRYHHRSTRRLPHQQPKNIRETTSSETTSETTSGETTSETTGETTSKTTCETTNSQQTWQAHQKRTSSQQIQST